MKWQDVSTGEEARAAAEKCCEVYGGEDMTNHIIKSIFDGETYDLTTNRIQLFLLPEDVQRAMQKWPHGWETISPGRGRREARAPTWIGTVVYRAKPAPQ